jgi:hypothetical protein
MDILGDMVSQRISEMGMSLGMNSADVLKQKRELKFET